MSGYIKGPPQPHQTLTDLPTDYDKKLLRLRFDLKSEEFLNITISFMQLAGINPPLPQLINFVNGNPIVPALSSA
jgi:hypothetical protein